MVDWINGFIIPIITITFLGGLFSVFIFFIIYGFRNAWTKSWKFIWKYKIRRKEYPDKIIDWLFLCIDAEINWYDAKKMMMVKMIPQPQINETLWIYDRIIDELQDEKGGSKEHGRKFERDYSKKISEFPTI